MHVTVRFFATLRDQAGLEQTRLNLADDSSVAALLGRITEAHPSLEAALPHVLVAVNNKYAFPDTPLNEGDEVALFPPISGGAEGHHPPTPKDTSQATETKGQTTGADEPPFTLICTRCGERYPHDTDLYRCTCGAAFEFASTPAFDRDAINASDTSIWRYRATLAPRGVTPVTLGEGWTPLIGAQVDGRMIHFKLESLNPTGSFKDRGAALLVTMLKARGVKTAHDDSSGNAGAALAAYAARAGLAARLFVPASASPAKLAQIALYGAELNAIEGPRSAATVAAHEAAGAGESAYASHVYNPFSIMGYRTIAYEMWEQLGFHAPDAVIMPLGQGTQLVGVADGFADLLKAGLIEHTPRLIGVQAEACAPLWQRMHRGDAPGETVKEGKTLAEGIRIVEPVHAGRILAAITGSGGDIVVVSERAIRDGLRKLAGLGISAEPTSAVVWAALKQAAEGFTRDAVIVVPITGSGYKTPNLRDLVDS
jgi:threonine synthase